eukprot:gene9332-11445_t
MIPITRPKGFKTGTSACGLKTTGNKDICVIFSEKPCTFHAVFTTNQVKAAPVLVSHQHLNKLKGVGMQSCVINSGCANACTGDLGLENANKMSSLTTSLLNAKHPSFVMSTGIIGKHLQMEKVEKGIKTAVENMKENDWLEAAKSIMTTDKVPKIYQKSIKIRGNDVSFVGICKGAGMIHPNMATMLSVICTDADISAQCINSALQHAVKYSFNSISVDGDMSTNDTVLVFANGMAGNSTISDTNTEDYLEFQKSLREVLTDLAQKIIRDAEGATKFITVRVVGAPSEDVAHKVANSISTSSLVKSAMYGKDANWGRVIAAVGYSPIGNTKLDTTKIDMYFANGNGLDLQDKKNCIKFVHQGAPTDANKDSNAQVAYDLLSHRDIAIIVDLGIGQHTFTMWTSDLTEGYVAANSHYRT